MKKNCLQTNSFIFIFPHPSNMISAHLVKAAGIQKVFPCVNDFSGCLRQPWKSKGVSRIQCAGDLIKIYRDDTENSAISILGVSCMQWKGIRIGRMPDYRLKHGNLTYTHLVRDLFPFLGTFFWRIVDGPVRPFHGLSTGDFRRNLWTKLQESASLY